MNRVLIGLSVGSGLGGADAAAVRVGGVGLGLTPRVERTARVPFPASVQSALSRRAGGNLVAGEAPVGAAELTRVVAETAVQAARTVTVQSGLSTQDIFAVGLLDPARSAGDAAVSWPDVADRIAEQTGFTVLHGFRGRDRAAGGTGHPITAVADYLLFRHDREDRVVVHLGAATGILFVPGGGKVSAVHGFECGPGSQLLDALLFHGTRGREASDPGGKKAVQGCCLDPLLARWAEYPFLTRKPPKTVPPDAFGRAFLLAAFDAVRQLGAGLPDLLCSATHLIARSVGEACRQWLPRSAAGRRMVLSGDGVTNGFLLQLLAQQFDGEAPVRADELGVPALARNAAASAILAALTCDGVAGNLSFLTGAAGGRLLGGIVPGDGRNWARCAAWVAEQTGDYPRLNRAA